MKFWFLFTLLFISFLSFGQESYYFTGPLPSSQEQIKTVSEKWFGKYTSSENQRVYEFSEEGVFIISTTISSISRKTLRESSKYEVRNGYLFGVVENDSVPCVLDGENYYFGIRNRDIIAGENSQNVLTKISDYEYILNFIEDGTYVPVKITFLRTQMAISYFDYEPETTIFDFIEDKKTILEGTSTQTLLSPDPEEGKKLLDMSIFSTSKMYKKEG